MLNSESNDNKISILLSALGGDFTRVKCLQCDEIDFLVPIDEPFDQAFLASYRCDKCDEAHAQHDSVWIQISGLRSRHE